MEGPDLNAIRRAARETKGIEKSKQEQIAALEAEIGRLEARINGPSEADQFRALTPREQEARLQDLNSTLASGEEYTAEDYIAELEEDAKGPSVDKIRLDKARRDLAALQESE